MKRYADLYVEMDTLYAEAWAIQSQPLPSLEGERRLDEIADRVLTIDHIGRWRDGDGGSRFAGMWRGFHNATNEMCRWAGGRVAAPRALEVVR